MVGSPRNHEIDNKKSMGILPVSDRLVEHVADNVARDIANGA